MRLLEWFRPFKKQAFHDILCKKTIFPDVNPWSPNQFLKLFNAFRDALLEACPWIFANDQCLITSIPCASFCRLCNAFCGVRRTGHSKMTQVWLLPPLLLWAWRIYKYFCLLSVGNGECIITSASSASKFANVSLLPILFLWKRCMYCRSRTFSIKHDACRPFAIENNKCINTSAPFSFERDEHIVTPAPFPWKLRNVSLFPHLFHWKRRMYDYSRPLVHYDCVFGCPTRSRLRGIGGVVVFLSVSRDFYNTWNFEWLRTRVGETILCLRVCRLRMRGVGGMVVFLCVIEVF